MQRVFHLLCAGEGEECAHCPMRRSRWVERADDYLLLALLGSTEVALRQNMAAPAGMTHLIQVCFLSGLKMVLPQGSWMRPICSFCLLPICTPTPPKTNFIKRGEDKSPDCSGAAHHCDASAKTQHCASDSIFSTMTSFTFYWTKDAG